ncbi:hypothetical protein [Treponema denticola]|uniref:hypothetical protein n=1 Tax=Treponema denticola TaxID=158 RepID=UPI0020A5998F|nr:hypothetical protein [Treponema denticola]UTC82224.1 hypothetical protein HGJ18_03020 [Treponema denticola]
MNKYIICTVGTSIANNCEEQKVLFKTQAGWDEDSTLIKKQLTESIKSYSPNLKRGVSNFKSLCAEINILDRLKLTSNDRVLLIASDNLLGNVCAVEIKNIIVKVYGISEAQVEICRVEDLQIKDMKKLRTNGIKNLISNVISKLEDDSIRYGYEIIFNPVGGYKFILPFMALLAMLYGKRSVYLFEYSEELLNLPALPFSFDTSLFNRVLPAIKLIEKEVAIPEAEFLNAIIDYTPSEHDLFMSFIEPYEGNLVTLSPLAYCFMKVDESKEAAKICSKAKKQLADIDGKSSGQAVKRIIKNSESPTWRNVNMHPWKTGTDLSVLKCGSGERVACFIKKGIVHIVAIFSDHADYERTMPKISQASFEDEIFTPCDFGDENFGSDDNNGAAVCEERNALQIKLKEIQAINETLQKENKNYNVEIELKEEYIESKESEIESLKASYNSLYNELEALKKEIQDLHSAQEQQKSFLYRLRHLFKY